MHQASLTDVDADTLCAVIVLRPSRAPRNRHFALFTTAQAKVARQRANAIRSVLRDLGGGHGPVRLITCDPRPSGSGSHWLITYSIPRVALSRSARLPAIDLSIVRVALARRNVRLLPSQLLARDEDQATVARLLAHAEASIPAD
ncbi:MAG: hypothetical protein ABI175_07750 [Polyangiales bacterium]